MSTPDDAWLDDLLEGEPYIDDDGFTDAVVARLPERVPSRRPWVLLASTLVGGLAFVGIDAGSSFQLLGQLSTTLLSVDPWSTADLRPALTTVAGIGAALAVVAWVPFTIAFDEE